MILATPFEHLHAIELPTPFAVGPVIVYLADEPGEALTLIDTGPLHPETRAVLEADLAALGHTPADLGRILITHAHVDHFGLAADLAAASGAPIWTHPWNVRTLCDCQGEPERSAAFYGELLRRSSVPADVMAAVGWVTRGMQEFARPVTATHTLDEGDAFRPLGRDWQVLHTPGHSAGLICLYDPDSRVMISDDHLLADISSNPVVEPPPPGRAERLRSLVEYRAALRRVAAMDVRLALPSHGPAVDDVPGLVARRLAFHDKRLARILDALRGGAHTTWDVAQALFPGRPPLDTFLAVSEVIGHLDVLEMDGKIVPVMEDGQFCWALTQ
jgi:glyoxylase-like metal-dependent hydrolase (beta-lactamase superfamily II)